MSERGQGARGLWLGQEGEFVLRLSHARAPRPVSCALFSILLTLFAVASLAAPATRIVTLAPHLTELTFAAGAGDRIVATVEFSDQPDAARRIPRIGDAFRVDLEQLLALRPDAVLVWESGTPRLVIERLEALNLPVVRLTTHRLADIPLALRRIGELAGTQETAAAVASRFESDMAALREEYRSRRIVSVFLQVNERPLYTVNGKQIMSEIVELCGGRNVFAGLTDLAPVIGVEAVIAANPEVILAAVNDAADALAQWRRFEHIRAVSFGNVYVLPSDDISRATTRLAAGGRKVCRTLDTARDRLPAR
jgi:iron complex transport system substrate-binding protein